MLAGQVSRAPEQEAGEFAAREQFVALPGLLLLDPAVRGSPTQFRVDPGEAIDGVLAAALD